MVSMPRVDTPDDLASVFKLARQLSADFQSTRSVAIVTPGRMILPIACPPADAVSTDMLQALRQVVPEQPKQTISVIANNNLVPAGALNVPDASALIPFLGYLLGLAFDGHTVVVFEGHPSALAMGCSGSTLLLVDEEMSEHLPSDWVATAAAAMDTPAILMFCRDGTLKRVGVDA